MKLTLLASAAAAVSLFALPALAQTTVNTGYVGASAGFAQADDVDGEILALEGAGTLSLGGTLGLQLDAAVQNLEFDEIGTATTMTGRAHLFTRTDAFLFGGFASVTSSEFEDLGAENVYGLGLEAQAYLQQVTLGANIGWARGDDDDFTVFSLGAEYKLANSPVSFTAGFSSSDLGDGDDAQAVFIGVRLNGPGSLMDRDRRGPSL